MNNDIILNMGMYTYVAKIRKIDEDGGYYTVEFPSFKGCITYGHTLDEAIAMSKDVLGLWLTCLKNERKSFPIEKDSLLEKVAKISIPVSVSV